jgi:hypothetical protein
VGADPATGIGNCPNAIGTQASKLIANLFIIW